MNEQLPVYNSRNIKTYLEYLSRYHPDIDTDSLLEYAGMTRYEVEDPGHWFTQDQIERFHEILDEKTGDPNISRGAGRYAATSTASGALKKYTLGFMTPAVAYWVIEKIAPHLTRAQSLKARKLGPNKFEVTATPNPGVTLKPFNCDNLMGQLEALSKVFTNHYATIEHPSCIHRGDDCCRYIITWKQTPSLFWKRIRNHSLLFSAIGSLALLFIMPTLPWFAITCLCAILVLALSFYHETIRTTELSKTIETQGDAAKDLLDATTIRYNSAMFIQEIGQATSRVLDRDRLIRIVMNIIEKRLDFDRGMIMLANPEKTRLVYAAGFGFSEEQEELMKTNTFHLDRPRSKGVFVRSFMEQKLLLLNSRNEIEKNLSKRSLEFARKMDVQALICVPIVYERESLGILAVDNVNSSRSLAQSDVNMLMGVASQTAVSITNAFSFEMLRQSEERYRVSIEYAPYGILVIDPNGTFLVFNSQLEALTGYTKEEVGDIQIWFMKVYPDDEYRRAVIEENKRIKAEERPRVREAVITRKDGEKRTCQYTSTLSPSGIRTVFINDITEQRKAQEALRDSEAKYRELVQNANSIIMRRDTQGTITFFNEFAQDFFGFTENEVLGRNEVGTIVPERDSSGRDLAAMIQDIGLHPEKYANNENENMRRDGERVWVSWTNKAIRDKDGNIVEILCIGNDITERKQLEAQLQQAQKMEAIGTLAGGVAHDFNNLLMGIQGRTSLMLMGIDPSHPHYEHLKGVEELVQSASSLTRQLLGFAKGGKYEVKPTNLNELLNKTSDMFARTKKEISIYKKYQDDIWAVDVDQGQIEQVLFNLYVNAWQAMPGGGELYLETENVKLSKKFVRPFQVEPGRYVRISVTDTGIGMDEKTQQRIFDPFFTTKEMGRGTGLGLASAYGIITNHGGIIEVFSKKGEGTTFTIYLPVSEGRIVKEEEVSEKILKGKETILLVDDEEMILKIGRDLLNAMDYKVFTARSGREAVELYKGQKDSIDLVILDMIMPEMGGGQVYDRMKEINPDLKVLLSSGYSIDGQAHEIMERGCDGFIQKPFNLTKLSAKIRDILEK
ncbi:MAG: PAS domain S-box protein [Deltaproteobacteria bacterium]|nr:PAS domain S-box protein [Deltaproteobacteria bacterium]